jgi:hypothetical protein
MKEHGKVCILLGGGFFLRSSWLLRCRGKGAPPQEFRDFEIFGFWGTLWTHGSTHRLAMDMGPAAHERARQIVYSIRRRYFFKEFLVTLVQGERSPPGISRFLGLGELYVPTDPAAD